MRLGVFGGAFDPPHLGHLVVAQEARHQLGLDRLLVVPTGMPRHRDPPATPPLLRYEMARTAFLDEPDTEVSAIEIDREGPSYTVDTLRALEAPGTDLFLVVGGDQYVELEAWREPEAVRALATIVVAARPGSVDGIGDGDVVLTSPLIDLSSSELRRRIREGQPVTHLIPSSVLELIGAERLYVR
jgi:nicotinate-nucleotide adenylyltransferase